MARRKRIPTVESMEQEIEKALEKVIKTKAAYDCVVKHLQVLLDKRDVRRKDDIWDAIIKSDKSYEEILEFITAASALEM